MFTEQHFDWGASDPMAHGLWPLAAGRWPVEAGGMGGVTIWKLAMT
jgi:hypothetical protein